MRLILALAALLCTVASTFLFVQTESTLAWLVHLLRLHQLEQFPPTVFFDEADNANVALRIVRNTDFQPVYAGFTNLPAHFLYVMAWMFQNFGGDLLPLP